MAGFAAHVTDGEQHGTGQLHAEYRSSTATRRVPSVGLQPPHAYRRSRRLVPRTDRPVLLSAGRDGTRVYGNRRRDP